jgi:5-methylcytosine-specific restriction enzyme subunit McrC
MEILRLCEWGQTRVDENAWPIARRRLVQNAAENWRRVHRLNALPLAWSGSDGCTLSARQWVGVLEAGGATIEIYPKTDKALLTRDTLTAAEAGSTLGVLLKLLEAAHFPDWMNAGSAALQQDELSFLEVWAWLYGWHLRDELRRGLVRGYIAREDDLFAVRGRIHLPRQLSRYGDRVDRIVCRWDEYSPDIALLRLLKCAARLLHRKTRQVKTIGLLSDCLLMLDEVEDVTPTTALQQNVRPVWTRASERFHRHFDLASWILRELGPQSVAGESSSWSFFVDMNQVFEKFVGAALRDRLGVKIEEQFNELGYLVTAPHLRHVQIADYVWHGEDGICIGDAKWKRIQKTEDIISEEEIIETPTGKLQISPADLRQLSTYAELYRINRHSTPSDLMLFFPELGASLSTTVSWTMWNGANLHLVPVRMQGWNCAGEALSALSKQD